MREITFVNVINGIVNNSVFTLEDLAYADVEETAITITGELELNSDTTLLGRHDAEKICNSLLGSDLEDLIDFATVLYEKFEEDSDYEDTFIKYLEDHNISSSFREAYESFGKKFVGIYRDYDHAGQSMLDRDINDYLSTRNVRSFFNFEMYGEFLAESATVYELDSGKQGWVSL